MSGTGTNGNSRGAKRAAPIDTLGPEGRGQWDEAYEQDCRAEVEGGEDFAARLRRAPVTVRAAHARRLELLDALPLGDVGKKVCVDFGGGPNGFASLFPKLQACARAIAIDLSRTALEASAAHSGRPQNAQDTYLTSRGDRIDLPDGSVDVVYAGESIERVENIDAFLEETHRILKPGGLLVLTTLQGVAPPAPAVPAPAAVAPEASPGLVSGMAPRRAFSRLGQMVRANPSLRKIARFVKRRLVGPPPGAAAVHPAGTADDAGPVHLGPLPYGELRRLLGLRFEVVEAHGYAGAVDEPRPATQDAETARAWAAQLEARPEQARGVVVLARRREDYRRAAVYTQQRHHHDSPYVHYRGGPWEVTGLHRAMTGRLAADAASSWMTVPFDGSGVVVHFWSNPWGGAAVLEVGGVRREVNLYNPHGGFKRVHIDGLQPGRHELRISGGSNRDPRSVGNQILFHQAIGYHRGALPARPEAASARPVPQRTPAEREQLRKKVASRPWFHTIDLGDGIVTAGCDHSVGKVSYLALPERLDGLSVLDIGAYDGFMSFECERRGASRVVAADHFCWTYGQGMATKDGFDTAKAALGSRVQDVLIPVEEISPERVGIFDVVLFLGVLYHAPDMIRYLRLVRSVCKRQVILETEVDALDYPLPAAVFYPGNSLNNDASNFWGPNLACVEAMLREVGFKKVERICTFNMVRRPNRPFHRVVYHAFV